jgi:uncharacterized membrane protein YdjX (TVP38/TMEM64 family)
METLKEWVRSKPFLAVIAVIVVVTIVYHLFFGGSALPDVPA